MKNKTARFNEGLEALDENIKKLHKEIDRSRQARMAGEFGIMAWIQDSNTKTYAESMNRFWMKLTQQKRVKFMQNMSWLQDDDELKC